MIQLGIILVTAVALSIAGGTAHGKMVIQTFPVLAGSARRLPRSRMAQSGLPRNPPANSAASIPELANQI